MSTLEVCGQIGMCRCVFVLVSGCYWGECRRGEDACLSVDVCATWVCMGS